MLYICIYAYIYIYIYIYLSFFWTLVAMICQRENQLTSRAHLRSRLGEKEQPIWQVRRNPK